MSWFTRARHNKLEEIVKRQVRAIGPTPERYGENQPTKDPVVIDRGPAHRGEQTIGQTAEALTELVSKLCPQCQLVFTALVKKSEPSPVVPKLDVFGSNLGRMRTPDSARPVNFTEALGVGHNAAEAPQKVALRKKEDSRLRGACKAFLKL